MAVHNQLPGLTRHTPDWHRMGAEWYWERRHLKGRTLMDAAQDAGYRMGSVLWPVTAGEQDFFNLPEIGPVGPRDAESVRAFFDQMASPDAMDLYFDSFMAHFDWRDNKDLALYGVDMAIDLLSRDKVDVLFLHDIVLDHIRHVFGASGGMVELAMRLVDNHIGQLVQAAGGPEAANFVFLGDHGQIDIEWQFAPNVLLAEKGLITLNQEGEVVAQRAYAFSAGFSCFVYVEEAEDRIAVGRLLDQMAADYPRAIEEIYSAEEAQEAEGLAGDFAFVIEGQRGVVFENTYRGMVWQSVRRTDYRGYRANHGHHPDKDPLPALFAFGPDIQPGMVIARGDILNVAPTLAHLLEVELAEAEGAVLPIFRDDAISES